MKTGLGLFRKYRMLYAYLNLFRFWLQKRFIGFDVANQFIQRLDKISLLLILKKNGAKIGKNCDIETGLTFHNCLDYTNLKVGNNCHIGKNCFFDLRDKITIEDNVVISMQCTFITHIDMSKSTLSKKYSAESGIITIRNNVYIGANVTILKGIEIQDGSFVTAGALVRNNIQAHQLVGGIPAKIIKQI